MEEHPVTIGHGGKDPGIFTELQADAEDIKRASPWAGSVADGLLEVFTEWPDRSAPWDVTVTWSIDGDSATPTAIELRARNGQPVTPDAWRSVKVATVIGETRNRLGFQHARVAQVLEKRGDSAGAVEAEKGAAALSGKRRRGRQALYQDDHFAHIANLYNAAVAASDTRPVRTVTEQLGLRKTDSRVSNWVKEARKRGLIPPTKDR